ncbi:Toxin RTX-I translocation ATP-binding protein [Pseudovibrio axinellae]|uniref:Toxin RTX-I translocation ATP-binding protein n=1 Tax=Pseudovibrio axinellae TaxID=989403 RepID=A0A165YRH3_9HYPH|nr:type I secretion system permease/ATPase [Pseudovibrio axinellae]KZL19152.1 Toxin RTX-I translocation ATP-binding protein [Pseudovibrio axinellae]SER34856.1 ATP-binding cassette, subfamily C, LapB [Pseudovibrio axinellae]
MELTKTAQPKTKSEKTASLVTNNDTPNSEVSPSETEKTQPDDTKSSKLSQPAAIASEKRPYREQTPNNSFKTYQSSPTAELDLLRGCLEILLVQHNMPANSENLIAGLPLEKGKLTDELLQSALQRAGFSTRSFHQKLSGLSSLLFPVVLFLKDGGALVLLEKYDEHSYAVALPHADGGAVLAQLEELQTLCNGKVLVAKPFYKPESDQQRAQAQDNTHWLFGGISAVAKDYVFVALAAAFINLLALASPLFTMNVYDRVLPNSAFPTLWVLTLGIAGALLFDLFLKSSRASLIYLAGKRADLIISSRLFSHAMHLKMAHRPSSTASFLNDMREFESLREFMTSGTIAAITDLAFLGVFLGLIWYIGGPMIYPLLVAITGVLVVGLLMQFPLKKAVEATVADASLRNALLVESLYGLETIKLQRAEGQLLNKWESASAAASTAQNKVRSLSSWAQNLTGFLQQLTTVALLVTGAYLFSENRISMGGIIACVILGGRAVAPLATLSSFLARFQQVKAAYKRLDAISHLPRETPWASRHLTKTIDSGKISLLNMCFKYPHAAEATLKNLNLSITAGERIAILGPVGSGKSTLGRILSGLYAPESGSYSVDNLDHQQYAPTELRRAISYIGQDASLFSGSIRDNIKLGRPEITDAELINACELSGALDFIDAHPHGFARNIEEGGRDLSSGQRQKVILARAFMGAPKILYLDEPTGMMDGQSEKQFTNALSSALKPDQTLIIATHRTAPLSLVNRLIILDKGRILADGPKEKVIHILSKGDA